MEEKLIKVAIAMLVSAFLIVAVAFAYLTYSISGC